MKQVRAIVALRMNYTWRGVWVWLRGRNRRYGGKPGWRVVLAEPVTVERDQNALTEGVFS